MSKNATVVDLAQPLRGGGGGGRGGGQRFYLLSIRNTYDAMKWLLVTSAVPKFFEQAKVYMV